MNRKYSHFVTITDAVLLDNLIKQSTNKHELTYGEAIVAAYMQVANDLDAIDWQLVEDEYQKRFTIQGIDTAGLKFKNNITFVVSETLHNKIAEHIAQDMGLNNPKISYVTRMVLKYQALVERIDRHLQVAIRTPDVDELKLLVISKIISTQDVEKLEQINHLLRNH